MALLCDELRGMMHREVLYVPYESPLASPHGEATSFVPIDQSNESVRESLELERDREVLCQWTFDVTAHFDFDWHIPAWTMNYYDRYIAKNPYTTGKKKRLVALACLWLGSKLHSNGSNYLSERSMVWLTRNEFTAGEIVGMEAELLVELGWLVHPPTAQDFIYQYLELLEEHTVFHDYPASWQQVFEESIQCAMAIVHKGHRSLRNYRPSCQAVAILIYSMYQHNVGRYINVLSELHRYGVYVHPSHSQACMRELVDFLETEFTDIVLPPMVVEEKDLAGDTRIESPVAISTSRSRNIRSV